MKNVYIENLGCAKNQVDAEIMLEHLQAEGDYHYCEDPQEADLILVNTCGFIESARKESLEAIFSLREACPDAKILMTGCLAQRYATELEKELPEADGFFGNRDLARITKTVEALLEGSRPALTPEYPELEDREYQKRSKLLSYPGSVYVKISEGCDHRCRYCAIPLIRGSLVSRSLEEVLQEVRELVALGIVEIDLIAQDLAAFGTDRGESEFLSLLSAIDQIEGDFQLRLLYIHPDSFPDGLIDIVKKSRKILPYFDIPFQHAAIPVLRKMGRVGTAESYLDLIERIRDQLPEAVIRSTFLLGFVGESEQTLEELYEFVKEAQLDWAGSFIYSLEEGTPAYRDRSSKEHKAALSLAKKFQPRLQELQQQITEDRLQRYVGRELDVLLEERIEGEDLFIGRTFAQAPEVDGLTVVLSEDGEVGRRLACRITRVIGVDLEAVPLTGEEHDG